MHQGGQNKISGRTTSPDLGDLIERLIAVVAEEAEHCERLLALLRQQQRHLVEGDTGPLQANVAEQETAIRRSRELEKKRTSLLDRIAEHAPFAGDRPDLPRLIATLSDDYGRRLSQLRESLARSIEQVQCAKKQNTMLIERSLSNIGETMRLLASANMSADYIGGSKGANGAAVSVAVDRMG